MAPAFPKTLDLLQPVLSRRSAIRLGVGGLAGGSFFNLFGMSQEARAAGKKPASVILIWMDGGPTHFETFDPKPTHRSKYAASFARFPPTSRVFRSANICPSWPPWPTSMRSFARSATIKAITGQAITT